MAKEEMLAEAEEIREGAYEVKAIQAPVLTGFRLKLFPKLMESPLGNLLYPIVANKSGITQVCCLE